MDTDDIEKNCATLNTEESNQVVNNVGPTQICTTGESSATLENVVLEKDALLNKVDAPGKDPIHDGGATLNTAIRAELDVVQGTNSQTPMDVDAPMNKHIAVDKTNEANCSIKQEDPDTSNIDEVNSRFLHVNPENNEANDQNELEEDPIPTNPLQVDEHSLSMEVNFKSENDTVETKKDNDTTKNITNVCDVTDASRNIKDASNVTDESKNATDATDTIDIANASEYVRDESNEPKKVTDAPTNVVVVNKDNPSEKSTLRIALTKGIHNTETKESDERAGHTVNITVRKTSELMHVKKTTVTQCSDENLVYPCVYCGTIRTTKYCMTKEDKDMYICSEECFSELKKKDETLVVSEQSVKKFTNANPNALLNLRYTKHCEFCSKEVNTKSEMTLFWEIMEFCSESCLSRYQKKIGSKCVACSSDVQTTFLGKYCVRFGCVLRQFCSSHCLEDYKRSLKVCCYCQKDIFQIGQLYTTLKGIKKSVKDFCSERCSIAYDQMGIKNYRASEGIKCSVCSSDKPIEIQFRHGGKMNYFCSDPCFVAFRFVNKVVAGKCDMCHKYTNKSILESNTILYDGREKNFCSENCHNIYIIAHRKIVGCDWCRVKKYNFDLIQRRSPTGVNGMVKFCSLTCLGLHQVSVTACAQKPTNCDQCHKTLPVLYHLTMSDGTIRNFCSYNCCSTFQDQFNKAPLTLNTSKVETITVSNTGGVTRKVRRRRGARGGPPNLIRIQAPRTENPSPIVMPIIQSVMSLAPLEEQLSQAQEESVNSSKENAPPPLAPITRQKILTQELRNLLLVKTKDYVTQCNVMTLAKPIVDEKENMIKPVLMDKGIQTDDMPEETRLTLVPVPIFIPSPSPMYSMPVPRAYPFSLPIPVPVMIPLTRNTSQNVMRQIQQTEHTTPKDPFEAELLMMAELVASEADKKEEEPIPHVEKQDAASPESAEANTSFGDDMLQMALKMATDFEEPPIDLDTALKANTITATQTRRPHTEDDQDPTYVPERPVRGRRRGRGGGTPRQNPSRRGRRSTSYIQQEVTTEPESTVQTPDEPEEKPDANMCLKYTFGVNAWKQWVVLKNAELERASRRFKAIKTEILQMTADELNFALCQFIKEVRKPNGTEYAPDTIYYLCLGIQQYLYENGRIDNIFCDPYYETFTETLDEICVKFSSLYSNSQYIVTRVEEEHLWESKQLGAHSPHVLLSTLMFFNTKYFNLVTIEEHMQLSFSHIMKHWKRTPSGSKSSGGRSVLLRFYPPASQDHKKKKIYEQHENDDDPLRCPVKLYEFYLSKCPESVKTRSDVFYLLPERSCVPDSPVWYSTMPLGVEMLQKMLHRVKMIKEINVALLTSQSV